MFVQQICDKNWHAAANTMTNQTYDRHMSIIIAHSSQSRTPFAGERRFSKSRGLSASVSFLPLPHPLLPILLSTHFSRGQNAKITVLRSFAPRKRLLRRLTVVRLGRYGGLMVSALDSGFEPWPGTLRCVLRHDTLLSRCLSPPRCINGHRRI